MTPENGSPVREEEFRLTSGVLAVAIADEQTIYAACMDGVFRVDARSGAATPLYEHESYVASVALLPSLGQLVSAGYDGVLTWFDLARGEWIRKVRAHDFWSWSMRTSKDERLLATVTGQYLAGGIRYEPAPEREPSVRVYDTRTAELLHAFSHQPPVLSVALTHDSTHVAAANLLGEIRIWNLSTGAEVARWTTPDFTSWGVVKNHCYVGGIYDLNFSPDDAHLFATGMGPMRDPMAGNGTQTWQRFAWREDPVRKVAEFKEGEGLMETLAIDPGGRQLVMGGRLRGGPRNVGLFDLQTGTLLHSLDTKYRVTHATFNPDGDRLILAGCEGQQVSSDGPQHPFGRIEIYRNYPRGH